MAENDDIRWLQRYNSFKKALLFGSRAKGNYRPGADIDLAVVGTGVDHNEIVKILNDIDDLGLLYKIELLDYNEQIGTLIGDHINRTGKIFYEQSQPSKYVNIFRLAIPLLYPCNPLTANT